MKRFVLSLLLVSIFVFSSYSSYSPWASLGVGSDVIFYDSNSWPTISYGIEASFLSFTFGDWTVSSPVKLESVTASSPKNGTMTMDHTKIKLGLGGEYQNKLFFISTYFYFGFVDYRDLGCVDKEYALSLTPGVQIEDHMALLFPLTYTFSNYYPSFNIQVAMKMGGKI